MKNAPPLLPDSTCLVVSGRRCQLILSPQKAVSEHVQADRCGRQSEKDVAHVNCTSQKSQFSQQASTPKPRSGGREPAVFVGNARARMTTPGFTQLRRTRTKSGGYQPAVARQAHLQRRYRTCSVDGRRCVGARRCNRGSVTTVVTAGVERESNRLPNRRFTNHGGLTPPALVPAKMRLCSAKVAFSPANERHTQERRT